MSSEQHAALKRLTNALAPFKSLRKTMPLQYISTLLIVATEEGLNVTEYAKRAGISQSLMTRHLSDLGEVNRYHKPGFGLVEIYKDLMDRWNSLMRLTTKGRRLVCEVFEALES
jgi:DNA-binding MarR family transcriptional regulator